ESLRYYMSVMDDGKISDSDTYEVSLVDMDTSGATKFRLLNRMLEARDQGDDGKLREAEEQYLRQECFVNRFLKLMD
ncbi:MAG: DUF5717 family protein, partial [Bilifractor sp.]|nr:DUF5717 family protein [Bilifractor sp.]